MYSLSPFQMFQKRAFDLILSFCLLPFVLVLLVPLYFMAALDTGANGLFLQRRVGRHGRIFTVFKLRTFKATSHNVPSFAFSTQTIAGDPRISPFAHYLRRFKLDEFPQIFNIIIGDMSFVGPRPDVQSFYDSLPEYPVELMELKPGLTGPASLRFRNEESILSSEVDPQSFYLNHIWPVKCDLNLRYLRDWSLLADVRYVLKTIFFVLL